MLKKTMRLALLLSLPFATSARAQFGGGGGIHIDPEGVLRPGGAKSARRPIQPELGADLAKRSDLRKVSLRGLDRELAKAAADGKETPPEVRWMAGLFRVEFIMFDRANRDVILAGPGEGWRIEADGRAMGVQSHRPLICIDDLAAAIRCVLDGPGEVRCSIDPTAEGLAAVKSYETPSSGRPDPERVRREVTELYGLQNVSTAGVPNGSRFALAMIDADYRMKRMALGIEKVPGLVTHLDAVVSMTEEGRMTQTLARWWFTPAYDSIATDPSKTVFQLRGQGARLENEEVLFDERGQRQGTGKSSPDWDRFSNSFTERFPSLEAKIPAFADLHNLFDLMMVAGLVREQGHSEWLEGTALRSADRHAIRVSKQPAKAAPVVTAKAHAKRESGKKAMFISYVFGGVNIRPMQALAPNKMTTETSGILAELAKSTAPMADQPTTNGDSEGDKTDPSNARWWVDLRPESKAQKSE